MPRVLVVDNVEAVVREVVDYLAKEGWETESAGNGKEALNKLYGGREFDAIVLDIKMPVMDGMSALDKIRSNSGFDSTCIVMLTAYGEIAQAVSALRLGAFQYVEKPFSMADLHRVLISGVAWQKAHAIRHRLLTSFSADAVLSQIWDIIADTLRPPWLSILLLNPDGSVSWQVGAGSSHLVDEPPDFLGRFARNRHTVLLSGEELTLQKWQPMLRGAKCVLAAPIMNAAGAIVGVIDLESTVEKAFDRNWVDVVAYLADLAGLALEIGKAEREKREQLVQVAREVRHNFATPAQVIRMQADELSGKEFAHLSGEIKASALRRLKAITDNADVIAGACDHLDDISQDVPLHPSMFDVAALLRVCMEHFKPEFDAKKIGFSIHPEQNTPLEIKADPLRIQYSVQCLLKNAIEAIEERRRQILDPAFDPDHTEDSVSIDIDASDPARVTFQIVDTGAGVLPDHEALIFQPLFSTKGRPQLGGFGLFSVKRIVERHRGTIQFTSKPGVRTAFTVTLPRS
jgi:signal transduction histidine kinase